MTVPILEHVPSAVAAPSERASWRATAVPREHGGWGLTLEPVLLGLLVAASRPGVAIGAAALVAFLARTPLRLILVDRRRHRSLARTHLAGRLVTTELVLIGVLAWAATRAAGAGWLVPIAVAAPCVAVELWYDAQSRGRRLVPELAGAAGMTVVAAAVVIAGDGSWGLAASVTLVLAGRVLASVTFVHAEIARLHRRLPGAAASDALQWAGVAVAALAVVVDTRAAAGSVAVALLAVTQVLWRRRAVPPAKVLGLRQLVLGLAVVAVTATGVRAGG